MRAFASNTAEVDISFCMSAWVTHACFLLTTAQPTRVRHEKRLYKSIGELASAFFHGKAKIIAVLALALAVPHVQFLTSDVDWKYDEAR